MIHKLNFGIILTLILLLIGLLNHAVLAGQGNLFFMVTNEDEIYNSPMIGNGQIVTTVGPTGYHNSFCPDDEKANRTIFWAGRRLHDARSADIRIPRVPLEELIGPTIPLVRFGSLNRSLSIDGVETTDEKWKQTLDIENGILTSELDHGAIKEVTESLVCLEYNMVVFHTRLINESKTSKNINFTLEYKFGDSNGKLANSTRLHITRPYPDDLEFGNVEGVRSLDNDLKNRPPHVLESLSVQYEIEMMLGEVHWGRFPNGTIKDTEQGGQFIHELNLESGQTEDLWFWGILSDRLTYTHFPEFEKVKQLVDRHKVGWANYWNTSSVEFENPALNALRKSCLYTLRCNASPWTIPPGYLSTTWEGRTFHDEFYPFMAMVSSNYPGIAKRIPKWRLSTLPHAQMRSNGNGTYYGWEVTETGEESAPYGHWVDEQFRHGQISEECWRYYLHSRKLEDLRLFYPVIKGCAEWMIHDVLVRDENNRLTTRTIADVSEHVKSAQNSIFVASAVVRCLENAVNSSNLLGLDEPDRSNWISLSREMRNNLPVDGEQNVYRYAEDVDIPFETAHLGMVYPFSFDLSSKTVTNTMQGVWNVYEASRSDVSSQKVFSYNWIWAAGRLATTCFYLGESEKGFDVLNQTIQTVGPFMAPNEHYREEKGPFLPWLTSGAGAYVYAMNSMFVQVLDEQPAILLAAIPQAAKNLKFENLLATYGITISGKIQNGSLVSWSANSPIDTKWSFLMPEAETRLLRKSQDIQIENSGKKGFSKVTCKISIGNNDLLK